MKTANPIIEYHWAQRRESQQMKIAHLAEMAILGLSRQEAMQRYRISTNTFCNWQRLYGESTEQLLAAWAQVRRDVTPGSGEDRFQEFLGWLEAQLGGRPNSVINRLRRTSRTSEVSVRESVTEAPAGLAAYDAAELEKLRKLVIQQAMELQTLRAALSRVGASLESVGRPSDVGLMEQV